MLLTCSRVIALAVMLVGLSTAQAADTTLTLACQGTTTATTAGTEDKPEPISMGIIVNFTKKTVHGFGELFPVWGVGDGTPPYPFSRILRCVRCPRGQEQRSDTGEERLFHQNMPN